MEKYPGAILDASLLPLPKDRMKQVIKEVYATNAFPSAREYLPMAFMTLSNFQDGVGPKPLYPNAPKHPSGDLSELNAWLKWSEKTTNESKELLTEWNRFLAGKSA